MWICSQVWGENSRLCGTLSRLNKHIKSFETALKCPKAYKVCSGGIYSICGVCGVSLHFITTKGKHAVKLYFFHYHDHALSKLARDDSKITNEKIRMSIPFSFKEETESKEMDWCTENSMIISNVSISIMIWFWFHFYISNMEIINIFCCTTFVGSLTLLRFYLQVCVIYQQ